MPHTSSAKKRLRQSIKRRIRNRATKSAIKTQIKRFLAVAAAGTVDEVRAQYNLAAKRLDKAAAKGVIHPNKAARKKSQLAKVLYKKTVPAQQP
jgi:small subunit ribosomal protein S20